MKPNMQVETVSQLLDQAERSLRGSGRFTPITVDELVERASQFAARVRCALDRPMAIQQLHAATSSLAGVSSADDLLPVLVDRAVALMGADFGAVQLHDPDTGALRLLAQTGFDEAFASQFKFVTDQGTPCGRAAADGQPVIVDDIERDRRFVLIHPAAADAGFRSIQSTPIQDYAGRTIGVISTHWRRPHRPSAEDMCLLDLFAGFAGDQLTRLLAVTPDAPADEIVSDGAIEAVARAIIAPLLAPPVHLDIEVRRACANSGLESAAPDSLADQFPAFAEQIVSGLLAAALTLDSAKSMVPAGPAAERLTAANEVIDRMLHQVRTFMVDGRIAEPPSATTLTRGTRQATPEAG